MIFSINVRTDLELTARGWRPRGWKGLRGCREGCREGPGRDGKGLQGRRAAGEAGACTAEPDFRATVLGRCMMSMDTFGPKRVEPKRMDVAVT